MRKGNELLLVPRREKILSAFLSLLEFTFPELLMFYFEIIKFSETGRLFKSDFLNY